MRIDDELKINDELPEPPKEPAIEIKAESHEKTAREIVLDFLVERNIITKEESVFISPEKVDEFIVRTAHEFEHIPKEIPQSNKAKTREIFGLKSTLGEGKIDSSERSAEIERTVKEMREYLEIFRSHCPEVLGMILCGSRMDPDKLPTSTSDIDVVLVLKEGTVTDPRTPQGEALLNKLRSFSDNTPTVSGFPVELDELYATDDLFAKLQMPIEKSKLIWGWNPNIVKYVGNSINGLNELEVQIKILEGINHPEMIKFKEQKVAEAKELMIRYLDQAKKAE